MPHPWVFLPGFGIATVLHSAFNHFFIAPTLTTVLILVVLPVIYSLLVPTKESERTFRLWRQLWQRLLHHET